MACALPFTAGDQPVSTDSSWHSSAARLRVVVFESYYGAMYGNSRYHTLLADHLDRTRVDLHVIVAGDGRLADGIRERNTPVSVVPPPTPLDRFGKSALAWQRAPLSAIALVRYWFKLAKELRRIKPDVLYVTSLRSLLMAGPAARLTRVPVCLSVSVGYRHSLDAVGFVLASRIVFLSDRLKTAFERVPYIWFEKRFRSNPIGLELVPVQRVELQTVLGLPPDTPLAGVSGMLVRDKGIHDFLSAAIKVAESCDKIHFLVIGAAPSPDDQYVRSLERMAQSNGLAGRVHFLGWRPDAPQLIASLDVYCLPSYSEGVPRSILEAMWAGVPVVATDVGATADLVTKKTGVIVIPGDVNAIAAGILEVVRDPALAQTLGKAARQLVLDSHSIESHCRRLEAILSEIAKPR